MSISDEKLHEGEEDLSEKEQIDVSSEEDLSLIHI